MTPSEDPLGSSGATGERMDRLALASARVPFRLKTAAVWAVIFVIIALFFAVANFDLSWMRDQLSFILGGVRYTIQIAVLGIALAVVLAGMGALARLSANPVAYGVSGFYVSFFRGTPLIVQMYLIYLALPQVGINLEAKFPGMPDWSSHIYTLGVATAGTIALGLNYGAYMTEIFRAGIQSVGSGQSEAAEALGMTYWQKMRKVILPQAFRVIIPPTGNDFISMLKDTALVSFLGTTVQSAEIFRRANLVGSAASRNLEALIVAAAIYWALTAIFTFFQSRLERRVSRGYVRMAPLRTRQQPLPAAVEEPP